MITNQSSTTKLTAAKHAANNNNNSNSRSGIDPPILAPKNRNSIQQEPATTVVNGSSTFPAKLHSILTSGQWGDVIQFEANGRKWKVLDKKRMEEEVLPVNFRHNKYLSFTRSVVGWGFKRAGKATYYHELFIRDAPQLCLEMSRKTVLNDESNNQHSSKRCRNNIIYSATIQNNASFQVTEVHHGILSPHSRFQQNAPIEHGIGSNIHLSRNPSQNNMVNTTRRQNIFHGVPPMGMGTRMDGDQRHASSQHDGRYPSRMQYIGLNLNSPPVHYNNQGIPINQRSHDYMYNGSSSDSQYSSLRGKMPNNCQRYAPGPVSYIYDQTHNGNVGI